MIAIAFLFVCVLCDCFKSRRRLETEIRLGDQNVIDTAVLQLVLITRSQNLAPSVFSIQRPRISFILSAWTPSAK